MLAICYLCLSYCLGFALCRFFFPKLHTFTERDFFGNPLRLSPFFLMLPVWLYFGVLPLTWFAYLLALLFQRSGQPLFPANLIAMGSALFLSLLLLRKSDGQDSGKLPAQWHKDWLSAVTLPERAGGLAVLLLLTVFMFRTLSVRDGTLLVGTTVYGDFTPHLSMIRSFSRGINFPTVYTPYAGQDVRYHFLFMFLSGNLEYLGLRLDWAFNLPTILGFASAYSLLYTFALKLSGKKLAGALAVAMALFRSSPNALSYLANHPLKDSVSAFLHVDAFLGNTPRENWGIYTINVFVNQRHLAFTVGVLLLFVLLYAQLFVDGCWRLTEESKTYLPEAPDGPLKWAKQWMLCFGRESLFSKKGWEAVCPETLEGPGGGVRARLFFPVAAGLYLGMIAFWNGAVVIAALLVLFVLAIFSDGRLSYLLTAVVAVILTLFQSHAFIRGSLPSIRYYFGYLAEPRTFFGVLNYLWLLTGLLLPLSVFLFVSSDGKRRVLFAAFLAPLIFTFTCAMSPDPLSFNHKFVDIYLMLLSVLTAELLAKWYAKAGKYLEKAGFTLLCVCLLSGGVLETLSVYNVNERKAVYAMRDETTLWIMEHTGHGDIFLTGNYNLNNVLLSGVECFQIWGSYAYDMGYDTGYRDRQVALMYGAESPEELLRLAGENGIAYIVVDDVNRNSESYELHEENIAAACETVFHSDTQNLTIYKVV